MAFFVEHAWVWVVFAAVVFALGYSMFVNDKKNRTLMITVLASVFVLLGGLALERYIETDREAIRRTLNEISAAVRSDNFNTVKKYIAPEAPVLSRVAAEGMGMAKLSTVRFSNVEIKINDSTVPMTAELRCTIAFRGRLKENTLFGDGDFFDQYKFTVIFEKHDQGWLATDDIVYDNRFPLKHLAGR